MWGLITLLFLFKNNIISQNLIQNGSFESYLNIDCSNGTYTLSNWISLASPDYFKFQCNGNYGIPSNLFGNSNALNGNSYIGIITYHKNAEYKEYIQQQLISPLILDKSYYLSFYVSRADGMVFSIKNLGCLISSFQPTLVSQQYISAIPQIQNQNNFITDTSNWVKIEGYFKAQGGEQYITIGNFNSNTSTDTLRSGSVNPTAFEPPQAYYYIDSVSLYDSLDYVTNIKKHESDFEINLYPNPSKGLMELDYDLGNNTDGKMNLYDVTGKLISSYKLDSNKGILQMNEQNLNNGVYFYHILVGEKTLKTDKIVIIK